MTSIFVKDDLRAQVEASTGGAVTVLYAANGHPGYYCVIPKFNVQDIANNLGTGVHPAFIVNGIEKSEIFIGQYEAIVKDGMALSLPGVAPSAEVTFNNAKNYCAACGPGFHLMTNAEWAAIALWCVKNGFLPRGNNDSGRDILAHYETGRRVDNGIPGSDTGTPITLTGSGPASWRHNGMSTGISDLNGNVAEFVGGLRIVNGEIQIIPNNDSADNTTDQSSTSDSWRAIDAESGNLTSPGENGTLKYDSDTTGTDTETPVHVGTTILNNSISHYSGTINSNNYYAYTSAPFDSLPITEGITVPNILRCLALAPYAVNIGGVLWARNYGERMASRGATIWNGAGSGMFSLSFLYNRSGISMSNGFRPAYVS
ncbi:conserved hypothetical protein [Gammaproteobacteria bacterium]